MHLVTITQQQGQKGADKELEQFSDHQPNSKAEVARQNSSAGMVPRQFINLGLGGQISGETDRASSPERGDPSNTDNLSKEDDADPGSHNMWMGGNKVSRLNPPKSVDEATEATIRKARVSVRARSEAPMVSTCSFLPKLSLSIYKVCY